MIRKSQIEAAAENHCHLAQRLSPNEQDIFIDGAEWADQNLDPGIVELLNRLPKAVTIIDRLEAKLDIAVESLEKIYKNMPQYMINNHDARDEISLAKEALTKISEIK